MTPSFLIIKHNESLKNISTPQGKLLGMNRSIRFKEFFEVIK